MSEYSIAIFTGTSNIPFAQKVADQLKLPLGKSEVGRFSDGEIMFEIHQSVRGKDVYIIQPTCVPNPSENLVEMLVMIDAFKRSSAKRISAVLPYYGFSRQDRRPWSARVPISAKLVADTLTIAGADRVLTVDLHADQIQGFFNIPVDNIYASPVFAEDIIARVEKPIIVSPDVGGVVRARAYAKRVNAELAIIDKRRPKPNSSEVMNIIGDIENRNCVIVDDMVDTAGTLCKASNALLERGAKSVCAYCTHPILSGNAYENLKESSLKEMVISDTIPLSEKMKTLNKIRIVSIAHYVAESIHRIHFEDSVSEVFEGMQ